MRNNIVLIDFENLQPESLALMSQEHFRVVVFIGAEQKKIPTDFAVSLQKLGARGEYVQISGKGPNALDLHIACCIGAMSVADPSACFHIVSKDTGFDPLIQHLRTKETFVTRVQDIGEIPLVKLARAKSPEERVQVVIDKLARWKAKPATVERLANSITSLFQKQLRDDEVDAVVAGLKKRGVISVDGNNKVTYASASDA